MTSPLNSDETLFGDVTVLLGLFVARVGLRKIGELSLTSVTYTVTAAVLDKISGDWSSLAITMKW